MKFKNFKTQILNLRKKAWKQTDPALMQQVFTNGFYDEHDDTSFHWIVVNETEEVIASARLSKHNSINTLPDHHLIATLPEVNIKFPVASLNRLVVHKHSQGNGLSGLLDEARIQKAKKTGCKSICAMTYGLRGRKLVNDGFQVFSTLTISTDFTTDKKTAKTLPPAFYYKIL